MNRLLRFLSALPLAASAAGPIQDNSFLIEEAYNQEAGVVQHINTFQRARGSSDWIYTFTQEWPVGDIKHQFSYTVPVTRIADASKRLGVGDAALNYRYQLTGDGEAELAIAPRLSVLLPTGDETQGRGLGAASYQVTLPASVVLAAKLVAHTNVGYTFTPRAKDGDGNKANLGARNVGQSFVWLAAQNLNFMLEAIYSRSEEVAGPGRRATTKTAFVSPGLRWSYEFPSGLQVVPGIAFPIGVGPSRGEKAVFLYLSFEHPFGKPARKEATAR